MAESIKVRMLLASYPLYDKKVLEELLQSCGGSVEKTRLLLGANSATEKRKHQEIESNDKDVKRETPYTASTDNINDTISANVNGFTSPAKANSKYQSSITPMLKKTRTILSTNSLLIPETNNPKTIRIYTPQQVQEYLGTYVEMYKSFLPDDLASRVLDHLMLPEVKKGAKPAEFHLFDNDCVSLHSTLVAHSKRSPDELFLDRLVYNGKKRVSTMYNDDMEEASSLISKFLNQEVIPKNKRLPFQSLKPWDSHYTVINYYKDMQNSFE
ncbi:uncharacterized protein KQ657_003698 [Scheffersomyces spartinae]|uniref:Uncharacterized protein n=1 Tax=Scheffersomyces spartinae TaxID=45513 RepID=A0A9P7VD81_9ASCO|nr:uncharacterized protein KQ657_003698 [Scheffersomyces spartinae]KAG7195174.1 hypothetical protein KQ657_003698 [Scheffersomyces spartinae]